MDASQVDTGLTTFEWLEIIGVIFGLMVTLLGVVWNSTIRAFNRRFDDMAETFKSYKKDGDRTDRRVTRIMIELGLKEDTQ